MIELEREWFDKASAAAKLNCSEADIDYLVLEDRLRYAVPVSDALEAAGSFLALNEALAPEVHAALHKLYRPDFLTCTDFTLSEKPTDIQPEERFLYLPHSWLGAMYLTEEEDAEVRAHMLQLESGASVSLWLDSDRIALWGVRLGALTEAGFLINAAFSATELRALSEKSAHKEASSGPQERTTLVRFSPPDKADELALDICDFANRYVAEYGRAPSAAGLVNYLKSQSSAEVGFREVESASYDLNGKKIKLRQIQERLRNYLSKDKRK